MKSTRAVVTGFFSTFGDLDCLAVVEGWLRDLGVNYVVAPYWERIREALGVDATLGDLDPQGFTHIVHVCGPFDATYFSEERVRIDRFGSCVRVGVNLSFPDPSHANYFDVVVGRDLAGEGFPDLAMAAPAAIRPLIGVALAPEQGEYRGRQRRDDVHRMIFTALQRVDATIVRLHECNP